MGFRFVPFSIKQLKVLTWWIEGSSPYSECDGIIADGSVRSGKTLIMSFSYILWSMQHGNGIHYGIAGKTIGSLRRNVVFLLKVILRLRGFRVKDHRTDNYITVSKMMNGEKVENYYYLFGGRDERSQDLVQGFTSGGFLFDEVALMPESFVNQAVARCSIEGRKLWFNCNPEGPYHWFFLEWILKANTKRLYRLHFLLEDNPSLSKATKDFLKRMFIGVFYKRYILGLWVIAEGAIYDMFSSKNVVSNPFHKEQAERLFISIDYGTQNPCTFGRYGVKKEHYHLFDAYYYSGRHSNKQKTDKDYVDDLITFVGNDKIKFIIIDPSATSLIAEVKTRNFFADKSIKIVKAKNSIIRGIQVVSRKLQDLSFTIDPECIEDQKEFSSYIWDKKAGARGIDEPLKENDHCMDRNRYAVFTDMIMNRTRTNVTGKGAMS